MLRADASREEALAELKGVFAMIAAEYKEKGAPLAILKSLVPQATPSTDPATR
jgi:hypothetical protein